MRTQVWVNKHEDCTLGEKGCTWRSVAAGRSDGLSRLPGGACLEPGPGRWLQRTARLRRLACRFCGCAAGDVQLSRSHTWFSLPYIGGDTRPRGVHTGRGAELHPQGRGSAWPHHIRSTSGRWTGPGEGTRKAGGECRVGGCGYDSIAGEWNRWLHPLLSAVGGS